ncbi:hypothetical protein [Vineibacter terrae]|uniref:hypothetical protein n=1 Tax=Vineibacter terrae TaxID=2586908 RepID=UPI002E35999C|nr:hypothetical protein [Vineibacter terrae]
MRGLKIAAIIAGAIVILVIGGVVIYRIAVEEGGPAFEKAFNDSFLENCLTSARQAAASSGKSGPEIDATIQRRCTCALEVVKPLPVSDKVLLGRSEEKQREVLAEVQKRCQ